MDAGSLHNCIAFVRLAPDRNNKGHVLGAFVRRIGCLLNGKKQLDRKQGNS